MLFEKKKYQWLFAVALVLITAVFYWPVLDNDFIEYDDNHYVYENPEVYNGLTLESVHWAFTQYHSANWHPLTWLSHMLDCELYGLDSSGHHLTSLLFHLANTILLFFLLFRLTGKHWLSGFTAALFALHPLHVQSVAWVAERKDMLSTFFGLLVFMCYASWARKKSLLLYILSLLFYAASLMSKPMLVTMPFLLLLVDYWPLQRLKPENVRTLLAEKIPFFMMAAASCLTTFVIQKASGAVSDIDKLPLKERTLNALGSYAIYAWKTIVPTKLAIFYPYPSPDQLIINGLIGLVFIVLVSAIVFYFGRRYRFLIFGWLWYMVTLLPVIGIVQVGMQARADRYTYIPLIGLFIAIVWLIEMVVSGKKLIQGTIVCAGVLVILLFGILTWRQLGYWKNGKTLFGHALDVTEDNFLAHSRLGVILAEQYEDYRAGIENFRAAIAIRPDDIYYRINLAKAYFEIGRLVEAFESYNNALQLDPENPDALNMVGVILLGWGRIDEAIRVFEKAVELHPDDYKLLNGYASALLQIGDIDKAISYFEKALEFNTDAETLMNLGVAYAFNGNFVEAEKQYQRAIEIDPGNPKSYYLLGNVLMAQDQPQAAQSQYQKAVGLDPQYISAWMHLIQSLADQQKFDKVIETIDRVIEIAISRNDMDLLDELKKQRQYTIQRMQRGQ